MLLHDKPDIQPEGDPKQFPPLHQLAEEYPVYHVAAEQPHFYLVPQVQIDFLVLLDTLDKFATVLLPHDKPDIQPEEIPKIIANSSAGEHVGNQVRSIFL